MYRTLLPHCSAPCSLLRSLRRVSPRRSFQSARHPTAGQPRTLRHRRPGELVAHNGQVLYQGASVNVIATHTPAAVDSIFAAQSMAKLLTSTLVIQLVDRGRWILTPASRYVPDLPIAWQAIRA